MVLEHLVPSWLRKGEEFMTDDAIPPLPNMAALPERPTLPTPVDQTTSPPPLDDKEVFGRAAVLLEQIKRDRDEAMKREQALQVQLTEAVLASQSNVQKMNFLELENAELHNNVSALQSQITDYKIFLTKIKQILDTFGIKAPEKKPRVRKAKKVEALVDENVQKDVAP